jgi:molybdenum cofactor cytidylyltransferase
LGCRSREIGDQLLRHCTHPKLSILENRRWQEGISTSITAGLSVAEERFDHVMILLGDMPHVPPSVIDLLIERYLDSGACMGAVVRGDRRCHPVMFGREMYLYLHTLRGDVGAKALFDAFPQRVCLVTPDAPYDPRDIDTPEDYIRLRDDLPSRG